MTSTKLTFAYLLYTVSDRFPEPQLLGVFKSSKDAKTHVELIQGEYVPIGRSNRVLQKINKDNGQFWYVEKHVMKDAI